MAAHAFHQFLGDGQPQARAAEAAGGVARPLVEALEEFRGPGRVQADAGVGHGHGQPDPAGRGLIGRHGFHGDGNRPGGGEFDGVAQEIEQDLSQPARIAAQGGRHVRGDGGAQGQPFLAGGQFHGPEGLGHQGARIEVAAFEDEFAGLDLGKVEDVVDHAEQVPGGFADGAQVVDLFRGGLAFQERVGQADDGV